MPPSRLRLVRRTPLEIGVRQVVQRHRRGGVEQIHRALEQVRFDGLAVLHQRVGGPVQLHRAHRLEIHPQQLPNGAALAQPGVGGPFGGRIRQPPDDRARRRGAQRAVDAQLRQQLHQPQLPQGPQPGLLHAEASRARQLKRIDIHRLHVARRGPVRGRRARQQLRADALRLAFDRPRGVLQQRRLTEQDRLDALAQHRPVNLGQIEPRAEVEQGALADLVAVAFAAHQPMGMVNPRFGAPGHGAANEHESNGKRRRMRRQDPIVTLWHYFRLQTPEHPTDQALTAPKTAPTSQISPPSATFLVKMG